MAKRANRKQEQRRCRIGRWAFVRFRQTIWLLLVSAALLGASSTAQSERPVPTVETIVARMTQARADNQSRFRPYIVTRDYTLFGRERQKSKSQVIADVAFVPPDHKQFAIQQSVGSGLGEKIVRRMLAREADITREYRSTDLSTGNYDFRFVREEEIEGQRCYMLELLPKRKDRNLLRGNIWVDVHTYLLRRTEGEPAKSPSWWLRDVRMLFLYGDAGGMWLQTSAEATANVRILGQHTMVSRDVKYRFGELTAAGPKQALKLKAAPGAILEVQRSFR